MPTVFSCIMAFAEVSHKCIIPPDKRNEIGLKVSSVWYGTYKNQEPLEHIRQAEPEGIFEVVVYPEWFSPKIYEIVQNYYSNLKRTRIPLKTNYLKVEHPALRKKIS